MTNYPLFLEMLLRLGDRLYIEVLDDRGLAIAPPIPWLGNGVVHTIICDREAVVREAVILVESAPSKEKRKDEGFPEPTWLVRNPLTLDNENVVPGQELRITLNITAEM